MFIDIHSHITVKRFPQFSQRIMDRPGFDVDILLKRMDMEEIDKSAVLPLVNSEVMDRYGVAGNHEVLEACLAHPDRLIPFCCVEPRSMMVWEPKDSKGSIRNLLTIYKDLGCKGIGELCGAVPMDDERYGVIFEAAGELKMPMLFHFQKIDGHSYGATDDFHLPRLETALKRFPDTIFIGHSMAFWSEMAGDIPEAERELYLKAPYSLKGRLWELFATYPNLYGDISAGSGAAALTCNPEAGAEFLERFQDQLCFGTDRFSSISEPIPPQIPLLNTWRQEGKISLEAFEKITHRNTERLLQL